MSKWRQHAFTELPEMRKQLQEEKNMFGFCISLYRELELAYERQDDRLKNKIYEFSKWCFNAPRSKTDDEDDLRTAIVVCFFEHLPQQSEIRHDVHTRYDRHFLESLRDVFLYHGSEEQFSEIIHGFKQK